MAMSDILRVKVMGKYDQRGYEFVDACWTQTEWLTDDVNNKSNDRSCFEEDVSNDCSSQIIPSPDL